MEREISSVAKFLLIEISTQGLLCRILSIRSFLQIYLLQPAYSALHYYFFIIVKLEKYILMFDLFKLLTQLI